MTKSYVLPKRPAIADYWREKGFEVDENRCFACGLVRGGKLERAHIIPRLMGGADDASNLHVLCGMCHLESENKTHAQTYWAWFDRKYQTSVFEHFNAYLIQSYGLSSSELEFEIKQTLPENPTGSQIYAAMKDWLDRQSDPVKTIQAPTQ